MQLFLRQIRKSKWYRHEGVSWLPEDELQADTLDDLHTTDNAMSVWFVADDRSNINDIVCALAAGRDSLANLDFALFDVEIALSLEIPTKSTFGATLDEKVNEWRRELVHLTARKLLDLAKAISSTGQICRISKKNITELVREAVKSRKVDPAKLSDGVLNGIGISKSKPQS